LNAAQLVINQRHEDGKQIIQAIGEVDLTTSPHLREAILAFLDCKDKLPLVIDLSQIDFIDSAGLALLVEARKKLAPEGLTLNILLTAGRQPERVLKLGRFDTIMKLAYSLTDL
jgi:anti-sigma B factor antagonist